MVCFSKDLESVELFSCSYNSAPNHQFGDFFRSKHSVQVASGHLKICKDVCLFHGGFLIVACAKSNGNMLSGVTLHSIEMKTGKV